MTVLYSLQVQVLAFNLYSIGSYSKEAEWKRESERASGKTMELIKAGQRGQNLSAALVMSAAGCASSSSTHFTQDLDSISLSQAVGCLHNQIWIVM